MPSAKKGCACFSFASRHTATTMWDSTALFYFLPRMIKRTQPLSALSKGARGIAPSNSSPTTPPATGRSISAAATPPVGLHEQGNQRYVGRDQQQGCRSHVGGIHERYPTHLLPYRAILLH